MNSRAAVLAGNPGRPAKTSEPVLQRRCACGRHTGGAKCAACKEGERSLKRASVLAFAAGAMPAGNRTQSEPGLADAARRGRPVKARGPLPEMRNERKPSPMQGSATIQCDGGGDYEIVHGGWAGATCGTKDCVTAHEGSHVADWRAKWPTGCRGQPRGYLPKGDPPDDPLMTVAEYQTFLKQSECRAHTVDLACAERLPKEEGCKGTVDDYIELTREQKANYCTGLSRGAKVAIGIGGGALAGAGIGALAGGPVGAAVGAGIGALVGGLAGAFL